jgi:hypothetical protein
MLFYIVNGNVVVASEIAEKFLELCQEFGVVGFLSEKAKRWHLSFQNTVVYAEEVSRVQMTATVQEHNLMYLN